MSSGIDVRRLHKMKEFLRELDALQLANFELGVGIGQLAQLVHTLNELATQGVDTSRLTLSLTDLPSSTSKREGT